MPIVKTKSGKTKHFPYTKKGKVDAIKAKRKATAIKKAFG